jgi:hypothetical protein
LSRSAVVNRGPCRLNSFTPISASSARIRWLTAVGVIPSSAAARECDGQTRPGSRCRWIPGRPRRVLRTGRRQSPPGESALHVGQDRSRPRPLAAGVLL